MYLNLEVKVRLEHRDHALDAETLNISREGIFIRMDPPKPIGTRVRIGMHIANEKFSVEGVVVRCVPDDDEPLAEGQTPGIAVFLTMTSAGFGRFCDDLMQRKVEHEQFDSQPTHEVKGDIVEAVRKPRR